MRPREWSQGGAPPKDLPVLWPFEVRACLAAPRLCVTSVTFCPLRLERCFLAVSWPFEVRACIAAPSIG